MRVGVDTFTLRDLKLDAFQQLDYIKAKGLEGAQFGGLRGLSKTLDPGELKAVRDKADAMGLYSHVSLSVTANPQLARLAPEEHFAKIKEDIEKAAPFGWHELHGSLGGGDERYVHPVPWTQHLADSAAFLRKLGPVLRQHGSRIDLETHGDSTTFELVRLIEDVGPDCVGICLDTANVMCHAEDPVLAAKRAAPYTHLTHIKDAVAFFTDHGFVRQTVAPGRGAIDWETVLPVLAEYSPNLPVSIEDHKWLFHFHCFEPRWLALHPDLTREELAAFLRLVWQCQKRLQNGTLTDPWEDDKIPHIEQVEERLRFGCDYLKALIRRLGLEDRSRSDKPFSISMTNPG
jgi:sugar phosphate isomerase/epimerase